MMQHVVKQPHYRKRFSPFLQESDETKSCSEQSGFYGSASSDSDAEHKAPTPEALPITAPTAPAPTAPVQSDVIVTPPAKPPVAAETTPSAVSQEKGRIGFQTCCGGAGWYLKKHLLYYPTPFQTYVLRKILEGLYTFFIFFPMQVQLMMHTWLHIGVQS